MAFYKWQLKHQWRYFHGVDFILVYKSMLYMDQSIVKKSLLCCHAG